MRSLIIGIMLLIPGATIRAQTAPQNTAGSQDTIVIDSLSEALARALKSNPTQAVYQQQIRQAHYNYKAAKGAFYPNATGSFGGTDNLHLATTPIPGELVGAPGTTYYAQFGKQYVYNAGITLTQNIINWQAVLETKTAENNIRLVESQQASYVQSLREQVARTYYSVLIAKTSLKIITLDEIAGDSLVVLARQRLAEGTGDVISLNQALISGNNIRQNKALSQQLYDQGIYNLAILLGAGPGTALVLAENAPADSLAKSSAITLQADKNLEVYRQQISISDLQRQSQKSLAYPTLSASAYLGAQQFRNDFGLSFDNKAWSGYRYVGLNLTIPLFTGLSNTYRYRSSLAQKQIAQLQYDNALEQSGITDRLLVKNHKDYQELVLASSGNFRLYHETLQVDRQKYEEGVIPLDIYLKAFQDYLTAENTYMNNLSQLLSIRATILSRQ
ncbi:MAG TPA: TolC family protein [Puia sp.]|nr:TolC family protein [Puia sp.]